MTIDLESNPFAPQVQWDISDAIMSLVKAQRALASNDKEIAAIELKNALFSVQEAIANKALYQIIDERKRLENLFKCLNKKTDSLFVELQTAEKAAQMLASYQDECH